jgi:hypothetical protein
VLIPVNSSCDGSSSSSSSSSRSDSWTAALPDKLRGMMVPQQIELQGNFARPLVQGSLIMGYVVAIMFLIFIAIRLLRGL